MPIVLDAVEVLAGGLSLLVADYRIDVPADLDDLEGLPAGWRGHLAKKHTSSIIFDPQATVEGLQQLRLYENQRYFWCLRSRAPESPLASSVRLESTLQSKPSGSVKWHQRLVDGNPQGEFEVGGYLGTATFRVPQFRLRLDFDIVPRKIDFLTDYRAMVESIARECQQLLLEWWSPTCLNISADPEQRRRTLLEQFLFLRHVLSPERLDLYLEIIKRNPHVLLEREGRWLPLGTQTATEFLRDPLKFGRNWVQIGFDQGIIDDLSSEEVDSFRGFDSLDTPPNRFMKFALESFRDLCADVIDVFREDRGTAYLEAISMRDVLDSFLMSSFFAAVGRLYRIPFDNQVLQKREGYKQVMQAWLLLEAAAQLDWEGREDVYDGTNRNVALLYEYWLYFQIRNILKSITGFGPADVPGTSLNTKPFLGRDERGLHINLKQGRASVSVYTWIKAGKETLRLHLYYNRTFPTVTRDECSELPASYTGPFRPDFTLVILPAACVDSSSGDVLEAERVAKARGQLALVHFDAKYRLQQLRDAMGQISTDGAGAQDELDKEDLESATLDIYRRGDLLKMHTYNDAISDTIGSYVLYPGTQEDGKTFGRYDKDDSLPGVGAFPIRPTSENGVTSKQIGSLANHLRRVLDQQQDRFGRLYRLEYWRHKIAQTPRRSCPVAVQPSDVPADDLEVLLYPVRRREDAEVFRRHRAIWWPVMPSRSAKDQDLAWSTPRAVVLSVGGKTVGWYAEIAGRRLITAPELRVRFKPEERTRGLRCAYYYLLELSVPVDIPEVSLADAGSKQPEVGSWARFFCSSG